MLVADSLGRFESCVCDGAYLVGPQRLSHQECTPPNRRLKLAAPSNKGRIVFVNPESKRRSLGALR